jgi:NAD(P)-dependent dehydrogenase (short-subunit alcohol dehydrogenase family)
LKKNIILAGGSGFLGRQFSTFLAKKNYNVHILDLKKYKNKKNIYYYECDLTKEGLVKSLTHKIYKKYKSIDVLINCVANDYIPKKNKTSKLENLDIDKFEFDLKLGITTSLILIKHVTKFMKINKSGAILNIGSDLSIISPNQEIYNKFTKPVSYSVVKHGVIGLTKYVSTYFAKYNIRCNALCPGGIYNNQPMTFINKLKKLIPLKRMARINELNESMHYLISDKSSYMTGQSLIVDGGRTIW